jgi:hypothetical protein
MVSQTFVPRQISNYDRPDHAPQAPRIIGVSHMPIIIVYILQVLITFLVSIAFGFAQEDTRALWVLSTQLPLSYPLDKWHLNTFKYLLKII